MTASKTPILDKSTTISFGLMILIVGLAITMTTCLVTLENQVLQLQKENSEMKSSFLREKEFKIVLQQMLDRLGNIESYIKEEFRK